MPHKHLPLFGVILLVASLLQKVVGAVVVTVLFAILLIHKAKKAGHTPKNTAVLGGWFGAILGIVLALIVMIEKSLSFTAALPIILIGVLVFSMAGTMIFFVSYLIVHPDYDLKMVKKMFR